jgi:tetratricopeptide (TPR) repeat protein
VIASLFHEYTHHLLALNTKGKLPFWYSEGLAEFLSTAKFSKKREVFFGAPRRHYVELLNDRDWLSIETVLKTPHLQNASQQDLEQFYALSWLLVSYAYLNDEVLQNLKQYLHFISAGETVDNAFTKSFGFDYGELDEALKQFVKSNQFSRKRFSATAGSAQPTKAVSIPTAKLLFEVGEFLLHGLKEPGLAKAVLERANALYISNDADTLALLASAMGGLDKGASHLQKAKQLATNSLHVDLVDGQLNALKMERASNDKKHRYFYSLAVDSFERVLDQAPEHVAALYALGDLWAANGEIKKAREVFEKAYRVAPDSTAVREALITLYFHLGETQLAEDMVVAVLENYHLPRQQAQAFSQWVDSLRQSSQ